MESPHTLVHEPAGARARARFARSPPGRTAHAVPNAGELVLGRYRLLERLGAGGFGVVWRAEDELLHREVAVKRILIGPDGDSERATREALAAARLAHPAIVALYEACVVEDACYLISELVDGETLAQLIRSDAASDEQVLEIALALAHALAHAHARGVIHRDIKPQNVLIPRHRGSAADAAKLTDFGGASLAGEDALTRTGDVLGTLAYMAPEQSEGAPAGEGADLYALALVTYETLSGENPVRGATPAATARRIGTRLEPLRRRRRDLPRALCDAIDRALAARPQERGTLADLARALEHALEVVEHDAIPRAHRSGSRTPAPERSLAPHRESPHPALADERTAEPVAAERRLLSLPRAVWLAAALALAGWQVAAARPGAGLVVLAALAPVLVLPADPRSGRLGSGWLGAALAPVLGLAGLAGCFPALAGQLRSARERAFAGALGYWWLALAEPLLGRHLWLGPAAGLGPRDAWEGSLGLAAQHVLSPLLSLGVLLGALPWALAALVLPWLVRGRSAVLDLLCASLWSAALVLAAPTLDAGLAAGSPPAARGAVLGAILGGLVAVAARALRGPV